MDNPEKLATQGTQDTGRKQTNIKQKLKAMHILFTKYGIYIFISK